MPADPPTQAQLDYIALLRQQVDLPPLAVLPATRADASDAIKALVARRGTRYARPRSFMRAGRGTRMRTGGR